ncbi:hypothetical protein [Streptomyces atacamensis]|uniref:hypothetical protein n=1 Tax=Streptomyces atacamensis TaxID=531966 RepID=UPI00399CBEC1
MPNDSLLPLPRHYRWLPPLPRRLHGWRTCHGVRLSWDQNQVRSPGQHRIWVERIALEMRRELDRRSAAERRALRKAMHRCFCRRRETLSAVPQLDLALVVQFMNKVMDTADPGWRNLQSRDPDGLW